MRSRASTKRALGQSRKYCEYLSGLQPDVSLIGQPDASLMNRVMDQVSDKETTALPSSGNDRDAAVVARFRTGDVSAFEELVSLHQSGLMKLICPLLASPHDAEDVLQDVFVSAFENLSRFRGEASFRTWITTIAVNKCRSHRRRVLRRRWLTHILKGGTRDETKCHENVVDEREEVRRAVARLPSKYREAIVLYYFEQMSVAEICTVLDRKPNAIEARLSRARRMLAEIFDQRLERDS